MRPAAPLTARPSGRPSKYQVLISLDASCSICVKPNPFKNVCNSAGVKKRRKGSLARATRRESAGR